MAIAYESIAIKAFQAAATSLVIDKPSGLAVGDMMVSFVSGESAIGTSWGAPSGWTLLVEGADGGQSSIAVAKKVATSGDVAASNFTWTHSNNISGGCIIRISGAADVFTTGAIDAKAASTNPSFDTGITPTIPNSMILMFVGISGNTPTFSGYAITNDNPSWTEVLDQNTGLGSDYAMAAAYATRSQISATGNFTVTISSSVEGTAVLIAIAPLLNVTVSPAVITVNTVVNAPTVMGSANVSPAVITVNTTVQAPTVTLADPVWVNPDKSSSGPWSNPNKS